LDRVTVTATAQPEARTVSYQRTPIVDCWISRRWRSLILNNRKSSPADHQFDRIPFARGDGDTVAPDYMTPAAHPH
jgi:hypothetical protein